MTIQRCTGKRPEKIDPDIIVRSTLKKPAVVGGLQFGSSVAIRLAFTRSDLKGRAGRKV
jgi:hypothetical protein